MPVVRAIRAALPDVPISIDTTRAGVAEAALDAGATCSTTSGASAADEALARSLARADCPSS